MGFVLLWQSIFSGFKFKYGSVDKYQQVSLRQPNGQRKIEQFSKCSQ